MKIKYNDYLTKAQRTSINNFKSYLSERPKTLPKREVRPEVKQNPEPKLHPIMTMKEVAEYLSVSPYTIKRWCQIGKLEGIRVNGKGHRKFLREYIMSKYDK